MIIPSDWIRIARGSSWQFVWFLPADTPEDERHDSFDKKEIRELVEGQFLHIRWPDGVIEVVRIVHQRFHDDYHDHGNRRDVSYDLPGFNVRLHNTTRWYPLDAVEVPASLAPAGPEPWKPDPDHSVSDDERKLAQKSLIDAIWAYRRRTGVPSREAKRAVEEAING